MIAPDDIQGAAEGVYFFENFPRMLKAKNDEFHKEFNKLIGIDDVNAREIGGTRVMDKSHGWQAWEDIFAIKQAVEASGYKTRKDVEGVIQALEGMQMKNSLAHPQGDKMIRKEDHVGIIDCYISRVENGKLEVKKRIPKEELAQEHAAAAQSVADAGLTAALWRWCIAHHRHFLQRRCPTMSDYPKFKVCAAHVAPVFLDARRNRAKGLRVDCRGARAGARLIAFPESFVPGFPVWAAVQAPIKNHEFFKRLAANSIEVPGPEVAALCDAARETRHHRLDWHQ